MPLNKLENFIKNTEGRILYVNPNDLDATDGIENQGNSLTKPFKTVQRALLEAGRFSYLRGNDNDIVEKTTILLFPGEHLIDNRPGFAIRNDANVATAVSPTGTSSFAQDTLSLTLNSNFDLTQEDNILYKFNSIHGGIVVPRGTSIVGLDLRKTKIRPKYVPNPTDDNVPTSAIFRITGSCYFWQFSIFDGNELTKVYTNHQSFSEENQSKPLFSHHKLTCFEYADGVNNASGYDITDLDMYYSKVSNAYNRASGREIDQKYPAQADSFAKQRSEWEIVGAFQSDDIPISNIISGDGATPGAVVTVTTSVPHGLTADTPIKIRDVNIVDYNISARVQGVTSEYTFTYFLPFVRANLPAGPAAGLSGGAAKVTIETDTVSGASPYIFNCSLRSVYGMNGMKADGANASGFRSMVVAQFTGISLQKDDRAFVEYNPSAREYSGIDYITRNGSKLSEESSSTNQDTVYHLNSNAIYRTGWQTSHIRLLNDATLQIVSVFAIGYHTHFDLESGSDASITNSNSNFGQFALGAEGFKKKAFDKDNKGYITSIVTPRLVNTQQSEVEWLELDVAATKAWSAANSSNTKHLYLLGFESPDIKPPAIAQGYRIGARNGDKLYVENPSGTNYEASLLMTDKPITSADKVATGTGSGEKSWNATPKKVRRGSTEKIDYWIKIEGGSGHTLQNGESIRIRSKTGELPEDVINERVYYAVTAAKNADRGDGVVVPADSIQLASSKTNANARTPQVIKTFDKGEQLEILSRVSDKETGEMGHPIQWDPNESQWFIHIAANSTLFAHVISLTGTAPQDRTDISYLLRTEDNRSLDEKVYKVRYVVPKEMVNGRDPGDGFVIQESSATNVSSAADFTRTSIGTTDYAYNRNPKFISTCNYDNATGLITVLSDKPHNLKADEQIIVKKTTSSTNTLGKDNLGFNGTFKVNSIINDKTFTYPAKDTLGVTHSVGAFNNNVNIRSTELPRFERNDNLENLYVYRSETITPYIYGVQDGVYYLYVLNAANKIGHEFTDYKYTQDVTDLYPQLDKDNYDDNPPAAVSHANRAPLGEVITNDLKKSITRETADKFIKTFDKGNRIVGVTNTTNTCTLMFDTAHQLNAVKSGTISGGSGHVDGTYHNVKLFDNASQPNVAPWKGAMASNVVVSGGAVTSAQISEGGSGYQDGETLYFDTSVGGISGGKIGGSPGTNASARITIATAGISTAVGNYVQVTGVGTATDGYYRITAVPSTKSITVAKTSSELIDIDQYAVDLGTATEISTATFSTDTTTFNCGWPHGLLAGNKFRVTNSSNVSLGDFVVTSVTGPKVFTAKTTSALTSPKYILQHGLSSNDASADDLGENIGVRNLQFYDHDELILRGVGSSLTTLDTEASFRVQRPNGGVAGLTDRFPLGTYIQIDGEIMRITSSTLGGSGNDELTVIRGSMGTLIDAHAKDSLIKKIKPIAIELRRPSIVRASGHTFEYVGYGPGNYSTSLPQVQIRSLTETEEFLSQAQERSCGQVVYTGMNNDGDFFVGNKRVSSATGQETTFDIPIPTVTGQDPNRLSVVFDEVIVKERILVEGGNSRQILSQFDGPVTFNGNVRFNERLTVKNDFIVDKGADPTTGIVKFEQTLDSDPSLIQCANGLLNGTLQVKGGVAIGKKLNICGDTKIFSTTESTSSTTGALQVAGGVGIAKDLHVGDIITVNTGIVPDADEGAYLGTQLTPWSAAYIGEIRIADGGGTDSNDNEIDTVSGNLTLDSSGGTVTVDDNLNVTGNTDLDGNLNVDGTTTLDGTDINGDLRVTGDITAFWSSDERLKDNITPIEDPLAKVLSISGNTFTWNEASNHEGNDTGVIAQEIEALGLPGLATVRDDGTHAVNYEKLTALLIEAVKELSTKVDVLQQSVYMSVDSNTQVNPDK